MSNFAHLTQDAAAHNFTVDGDYAVCTITGAAFQLVQAGRDVIAKLRGAARAACIVTWRDGFSALRDVVAGLTVRLEARIEALVGHALALGCVVVYSGGVAYLSWVSAPNLDGNVSPVRLELWYEVKRRRHEATSPAMEDTIYVMGHMPNRGAKPHAIRTEADVLRLIGA